MPPRTSLADAAEKSLGAMFGVQPSRVATTGATNESTDEPANEPTVVASGEPTNHVPAVATDQPSSEPTEDAADEPTNRSTTGTTDPAAGVATSQPGNRSTPATPVQATGQQPQQPPRQRRPRATVVATTQPASWDAAILPEVIESVMTGKPLQGSTTRYSAQEWETLDIVEFELRRICDVSIPKQDIVRFGLSLVLADWKARGSESTLGQLAAEFKYRRPARGGLRPA
jgi:hypothetical protein